MTVEEYAQKYGEALAYFGPLHIMTSDGNCQPGHAAFCITEMFAFIDGHRRDVWEFDPPADVLGYIADSLSVISELIRTGELDSEDDDA